MGENIKSDIMELGRNYPSEFREARNNILNLEITVAERKAFLSRQRLTYRCSLKIYDNDKIVKFFEILKESGAGVSAGSIDDDFSPGFGFKAEKTKIGFSGREGNIKEQSDLFRQKYEYNFNFEKIRNEIKEIADRYGYEMQLVLVERSL